ncbi:oxygenase MpaB family protein [Streptomyces sp. CRN 30]|uniref:oxygenase MpaB family protein n=1 Tax=Streptomyces sp. CRN 30 TaxID=3075613 RepID=UPI002A7EF034|nr:oxygenase MpaB family protein [Streptomyces sp. CRN 30]
MDGLSRRKMLTTSGALGAFGALSAASPAGARSLWSWAPSGSVAGRGAGADPEWVWDEEVDRLVAAVIDRGDVVRVNEGLRAWTRNDQPVPAGLPADVREYMEQARTLPAWADRGKLETAARFNETRGLYLNLLNGVGGGMLSTAIPREARSVYWSKGGADMEDRVAKTSLLGFAVGDLNAYRADGDVVVQAVKTRLVHAAVRHLLPESPQWSRTSGGQTVPISQADLLVTWHSLPTYTMRKLLEWKVPVTAEDSAAYLHLWQVTAHLLGIRDEYIPATWETAESQYGQVLEPILAPTPEGVELTDILLGQLAEQTSPGGVDRPLVNALARYLVGDRVADWDGIPREPFWEKAIATAWPKLVAFREKLIPLPLVPPLAWTIDEAARQYILFYLTKGRGAHIEIPDTNRPT